MAKLSSGKLELEINVAYYFIGSSGDEEGFIDYNFNFLWGNESMINENLMKNRNSEKAKYKACQIETSDSLDNDFLIYLRKLLDQNTAISWGPMDPDIYIEMFPAGEEEEPLWENEEFRLKRKKRKLEKLEKGKLPDDMYRLAIMFDAYTFKSCNAYKGQGPGLFMMADREQLEKLYNDLKAEQEVFLQNIC